MSADLKALGFDVKPNGVDANKWYADLAAGTFDSAIHWGNTGPSPYAQYEGWLDPAIAKGNNASGNYGRFERSGATAALNDYAKAGTEAESARLPSTLWRRSCPTRCPLRRSCTRPAGTSTTPRTTPVGSTRDNQYMDPSPNPANVAYVILHLIPKG